MVVEICPNCQQRYSREAYDTSFVHTCNSGRAVLDTDSILKRGNYEDEVTKQTVQVPNANLLDSASKLRGTRGGIEGNTEFTRNVHGKNVTLFRTRQHFEHIRTRPHVVS